MLSTWAILSGACWLYLSVGAAGGRAATAKPSDDGTWQQPGRGEQESCWVFQTGWASWRLSEDCEKEAIRVSRGL